MSLISSNSDDDGFLHEELLSIRPSGTAISEPPYRKRQNDESFHLMALDQRSAVRARLENEFTSKLAVSGEPISRASNACKRL